MALHSYYKHSGSAILPHLVATAAAAAAHYSDSTAVPVPTVAPAATVALAAVAPVEPAAAAAVVQQPLPVHSVASAYLVLAEATGLN